MIRYVYLILVCLISTSSYSQNITPSLELGSNLTFVNLKSKYELNVGDPSPYIGFEGNFNLRFKVFEKGFLKTNISFQQRNITIRDGFQLFDNVGNSLGQLDKVRISNNYFTAGALYFYSLSERFHVGAGINAHYLLFSKTHIAEFKNQKFYLGNGRAAEGIYNNNYFKKVNLSIPIQLVFDISKVYLYAGFDKGIFNRIEGKDALYKEIESSVQLGIGFRFKK